MAENINAAGPGMGAYGEPGYNPMQANTQYAYNASLGYQQQQYQQDQAKQQAALQQQNAQQQQAASLAAQQDAQRAAAAQQAAQIGATSAQQQAQLDYQRQQDAVKQGNFNTVYGNLAAQQAAFAQQLSAPNPYGQQPRITSAPVWTQQATQQNLNANRASTDRSTETQVNNMQGQMAGRGFGGRSPLAAALENQTRSAAMGQKADYTRDFTQSARQANVSNYLQTQGAQENQYASRQQEANQRYNTNQQAQSSLYSALANLV